MIYYTEKMGPAKITINGSEYWAINGVLHREDGPAIKYANGICFWYKNGERHREDGPAIEEASTYGPAWYLNGVELTEQEFKQYIRDKKLNELI